MKCKVIIELIFIIMLVSCSQIKEKPKRLPASLMNIGIVGPDDDVILYYKADSYIIIRSCDPSASWGTSADEIKKNCQGKLNTIPVKYFKQALRNLVAIDKFNVLNSLSSDEVAAYKTAGQKSKQIEIMIFELNKINSFIKNYGAGKASIVDEKEFILAFSTTEARANILRIINTEIETAIDLITEQPELALIKSNTDKYEFLYMTLKNFNPADRLPCGLMGSIDERIQDCSNQKNSTIENFSLVTRTNEFIEIHKDNKTGLLWGERLPKQMDQYNAMDACRQNLNEFGNLKPFKWSLPSLSDYRTADTNGIRKALPNINYWWWTSTLYQSFNEEAWLFNGSSSSVDTDQRDESLASVRCIGK